MSIKKCLALFFLAITSPLKSADRFYEVHKKEAGLLEESMFEEEDRLKELDQPLDELKKLQGVLEEYQQEIYEHCKNLQTLERHLEGAFPETTEELQAVAETKDECEYLRKRMETIAKKLPDLRTHMKSLALEKIEWQELLFQEAHIKALRAILYPKIKKGDQRRSEERRARLRRYEEREEDPDENLSFGSLDQERRHLRRRISDE